MQSDTGDGKSTPAYSILNFCHGVDLKNVNVTQLNVKRKLDVKVMATAAHITHSLKLLKYCTHGEYNLAHLTVFIATDTFKGFIFANLLIRQF